MTSKSSAATFLNRCVFLCVHTGKHENTAVRGVFLCVEQVCLSVFSVHTDEHDNTAVRGANPVPGVVGLEDP
jgi:prephenate dehydrogenase